MKFRIKKKTGILKIYTGESDRLNSKPLYEEIILQARKNGLAGATAYKGVMSFGASHSIHTLKVFALSGDMPIIIEIVDSKKELKKFIPQVNKMFEESKKGGLITFQKVRIVRYTTGQKYNQFNSLSSNI
jgi:PII-like signaling protein